ncbi:MAG: ABC transporter ATP-binding protein [Acidobacteria bacterium]|nr:ABC transporter ATP-binding protein [Acidobacteriota bacterium]
MTAIVAEALTKRFGDVVALDSLDLTIESGEVFGYLGPNGAGKTTTIRLLLDFLRPTSGSVRVLGRPPTDVSVRHKIGYLPAEVRLDPSYTGEDVFRFFAALRGVVDRTRQTSLCDRFGLDPTRRIGELSTGNRRKVAIVQAFLHGPDLLVLDEPTSGLDPLLQEEFHRLVREESARGATVFLSSHMLPEVEQLAQRVGVLRAGCLATVTDLDELRSRARQRIDLHIDGPADAAVFEGVTGVVEARADQRVVHLVVEGSVDGVVKAASRVRVHRWVTHDVDLEEMFLELYR